MGNWIAKNLKYLADCALEVFSGDDGCCILCGEYCGVEQEEYGEEGSKVVRRGDVDNLQLCSRCMSSIKLCRDSTYLEIMEIGRASCRERVFVHV
jgi:hypothetical protein